MYIDGFEHLNFTTNRCSFFIHLIDENNMQLKYNNDVTFSHFHGKAVNNLAKLNFVNTEEGETDAVHTYEKI